MSAGHLCGAPCPDPIGVMPCSRFINHAGYHRSESGGWPNADEAPPARLPQGGSGGSSAHDEHAAERRRMLALSAAVELAGRVEDATTAVVLAAAEAFEAYLRGDQ